jgi:sialate O-acetylesterase
MAYGEKIEHSGPLYKSMKVEQNQIRVAFDHALSGLVIKGDTLKGFAIAGSDMKWVRANAKIDGNTVIVSSAEVSAPVSVRYAWAKNPEANLYNKEGLPASPFRTDK